MRHRLIQPLAMTLALSLATAPALPVQAQGSSGGLETYGERLTMVFLDRRCDLLVPEEKLAVVAFAAQARGGLLRAGVSPTALDARRDRALADARGLACNAPDVTAEATRLRKAYGGWKMVMRSDLPGQARSWALNRSGLDGWRVWQVLAGEDMAPGHVRAGLIRHADGGIRFALEVPDASVSAIRVHLRDRAILPLRGGALGLSPPPRAATIQLNGAQKLPAITRPRVATEPRAGTMMVFGVAETRQIVRADPRDAFEVEIVRRDGSQTSHVVEAGDIVVGYAFAALS